MCVLELTRLLQAGLYRRVMLPQGAFFNEKTSNILSSVSAFKDSICSSFLKVNLLSFNLLTLSVLVYFSFWEKMVLYLVLATGNLFIK